MTPKTASIVIVDDDRAFRTSLGVELRDGGYRVQEADGGIAAREILQREEVDIVLLDLRMPGEDGLSVLEWLSAHSNAAVIVLTGHGTVQTAIKAMKLGAADYLAKPCDLDELDIAIGRCLETRRLRERAKILESRLAGSEVAMVGESPAFRTLLAEIERAAQSTVNVLVWGESGTGKELVARKLHQASRVSDKPFVVVDCSILSGSLMQSELFGHEKGSYTGATERKHGLLEVADGGTVCLDEVGELEPALQARLLRVLDGGTFRRVGGTREIRVDVRFVGVTNRRLEQEVAAGNFREDLFYRLSLLTIEVPSLRERRSDVPLLARYFLARALRGRSTELELSDEALEIMMTYDWPGNIRQLWGVVEQLVAFAKGPRIGVEDLRPCLRLTPATASPSPNGDLTLDELERRHITAMLNKCDGHRAEAAARLGISERTLYRKIKTLGL